MIRLLRQNYNRLYIILAVKDKRALSNITARIKQIIDKY